MNWTNARRASQNWKRKKSIAHAQHTPQVYRKEKIKARKKNPWTKYTSARKTINVYMYTQRIWNAAVAAQAIAVRAYTNLYALAARIHKSSIAAASTAAAAANELLVWPSSSSTTWNTILDYKKKKKNRINSLLHFTPPPPPPPSCILYTYFHIIYSRSCATSSWHILELVAIALINNRRQLLEELSFVCVCVLAAVHCVRVCVCVYTRARYLVHIYIYMTRWLRSAIMKPHPAVGAVSLSEQLCLFIHVYVDIQTYTVCSVYCVYVRIHCFVAVVIASYSVLLLLYISNAQNNNTAADCLLRNAAAQPHMCPLYTYPHALLSVCVCVCVSVWLCVIEQMCTPKHTHTHVNEWLTFQENDKRIDAHTQQQYKRKVVFFIYMQQVYVCVRRRCSHCSV